MPKTFVELFTTAASSSNENKISDRWQGRALFSLHNSSFSLAALRPAVRCIARLGDLAESLSIT
jgi:hypothetical protein